MGGNRSRIGAFKLVELLDQRRKGRVVGDGIESVAGGFIRNGTDRLLDIRDNRGIDAGVLEAHLHVVRARAAGKGDKSRCVGDALKVDVVDPRDIVAVGVVVVEEERAESAACRLDGLDLSIEAHGIFGQVCLDGSAGDIPTAHATTCWHVGVERGLQACGVYAQLVGGEEGCGYVVDHIQAVVACGDVHGSRVGRRSKDQVKAVAVAAELHARHATDKPRAGPAARGAMVCAKLSVLHIVVLQRCVAL